ncbi:MAG: hypothetical protein V4801_10305 [Burkholderia gladioli]|uniref:hypothetical protein n=1 Tax=Burkholderia gladioli TaxID=28095 RepID=UPI00164168B9|nr:hypothetical protein [Burkholderia gladioli]
MAFKLNLNDKVSIAASGEKGEVIGRAEYTEAHNGYLVRYTAADGRATEAWWNEGALARAADLSKL